MEGDTSKSQSKHEDSQIIPGNVAENAKGEVLNYKCLFNELVFSTFEYILSE